MLDSTHLESYTLRDRYKVSSFLRLFTIGLAAITTFCVFILFDPHPSWLLATSATLNVSIILWDIYTLYDLKLLLSPMAGVVIGPAWIIQYSWGNLSARIAGNARLGSNPGSLDYYPLAGLLSTVGLLVFSFLVFSLLKRYSLYYQIRYEDLTWQPWQALVTSFVTIGVLVYLSTKYEFVNGYFRDVYGQFDKALSASNYFFVTLTSLIGVSVAIKSQSFKSRLMGWIGIVLPIVISLGLRSRTSMLLTVITISICWITLKPKHTRRVVILGLTGSLITFLLGTLVKEANVSGDMVSISQNFQLLIETNMETLRQVNAASATLDVPYRLAGFELPAALLMSQENGASPLYGQGMMGGLTSALPSILRPSGLYSERLAIYRGNYGYGLFYGDSIGVPLSSGIADWGMYIGPFIYIIIGIYCVVLWRFVQITPSLFVAYLIVGAGIGDLFWENALYIPRAIFFVWIFIMLLGKLVLPVWSQNSWDYT